MSQNIVIVDDQEICRFALERVIRDTAVDLNIFKFSDAETALNWIENNAVDLVITDFVMPGKYDGMELLRRLKGTKKTSHIPVMIVTGRDDDESRREANALEVMDYLTKPFDTDMCRFRVRNVLRITNNIRESRENFARMEELRAICSAHEKAVLEDAQKLAREAATSSIEAKDLFVAMVSHEFRTPLQSIISTIETLSRRVDKLDLTPEDSDTLRTPMRRLQQSAEELLQQASGLADFVSAEAGRIEHKPRRVDLPLFLEDVIAQYASHAEQKSIQMHVSARDIEVNVDPMRLRQIASNLVGNSVKYTKNGSITAVLTVVELPLAVDGSANLVLTVSDTGMGISENFLKNAFQPYVRGESVTGQNGMGLGLAIVQMLVSSMNGTISIESVVGVGTTIVVTVPVNIASPMKVIDTTALRPVDLIFPHTVLVVDDTQSTRFALVESLGDIGARVANAASGDDALAAVAISQFEVILVDLQMPGMNGYELAQKIRDLAIEPRPIVVAMSAYELDKTRAVNGLFDGFISKPVTLISLVRNIKSFRTTIFDKV